MSWHGLTHMLSLLCIIRSLLPHLPDQSNGLGHSAKRCLGSIAADPGHRGGVHGAAGGAGACRRPLSEEIRRWPGHPLWPRGLCKSLAPQDVEQLLLGHARA